MLYFFFIISIMISIRKTGVFKMKIKELFSKLQRFLVLKQSFKTTYAFILTIIPVILLGTVSFNIAKNALFEKSQCPW